MIMLQDCSYIKNMKISLTELKYYLKMSDLCSGIYSIK